MMFYLCSISEANSLGCAFYHIAQNRGMKLKYGILIHIDTSYVNSHTKETILIKITIVFYSSPNLAACAFYLIIGGGIEVFKLVR